MATDKIIIEPSKLRKYFTEFTVMALACAVVYLWIEVKQLNKYIRENCLTKQSSVNNLNLKQNEQDFRITPVYRDRVRNIEPRYTNKKELVNSSQSIKDNSRYFKFLQSEKTLQQWRPGATCDYFSNDCQHSVLFMQNSTMPKQENRSCYLCNPGRVRIYSKRSLLRYNQI